jgi:hypothetical protein
LFICRYQGGRRHPVDSSSRYPWVALNIRAIWNLRLSPSCKRRQGMSLLGPSITRLNVRSQMNAYPSLDKRLSYPWRASFLPQPWSVAREVMGRLRPPLRYLQYLLIYYLLFPPNDAFQRARLFTLRCKSLVRRALLLYHNYSSTAPQED